VINATTLNIPSICAKRRTKHTLAPRCREANFSQRFFKWNTPPDRAWLDTGTVHERGRCVLNIGKLRRGGENYYLNSVARGVEDYYLGSGEAEGCGKGTPTPDLGVYQGRSARGSRIVSLSVDALRRMID
jgi:hypothetical protein